MKLRNYWINKIETEWEKRSVLWLAGVRRSGKTILCQSLDNIEYFDCELPRTRRQMEDPEAFLSGLQNKRIVLDEIHRLKDPSQLLKIAADHYPTTKVIATGSSTLQASAKFRDSLTGRKTVIWLTPMISLDLRDFQNNDLLHRLHFGGLPPLYLNKEFPELDYQEWLDSYWAKDIQELFRLGKHASFIRFLELIMINSGGIFEATKYAVPCEISRPTVSNYLNVLEKTYTAHIIRPYSDRKATEIISAPKVYSFDTGFVCNYRGWNILRDEDLGFLWEHYVLNEIYGQTQRRAVHYWRNKKGHEVDFVLTKQGQPPIAIECKWKAGNIDLRNLKAFRRLHPGGKNYIVSSDIDRSYEQSHNDITVHFVSLPDLIKHLTM